MLLEDMLFDTMSTRPRRASRSMPAKEAYFDQDQIPRALGIEILKFNELIRCVLFLLHTRAVCRKETDMETNTLQNDDTVSGRAQ